MNSDVTLDQALANLRSGGLTGSALTGAEAALRGYYANRPAPQGTAYTPPQAGNTQAITPTSLTTQNPFILPTARPTTSADGFMAELEGYQPTVDALVPRDTQLENNQAQVQQTFFDRLLGRKGQNELTNEAYSKDVDPAKKELDEIQNTIRAKQLAARREVEALQKNGAMTKEQAAAFITEANRKNASELADLSVIEQAKQQNYDTAKSIADRKVAIEMERDNQQLDALKEFIDTNQGKIDKIDERRFQLKYDELKRAKDQKETEKKAVNELVIAATKYNAPNALLRQAQGAKTAVEAAQILKGYLSERAVGDAVTATIGNKLRALVGNDGYTNTDEYAKLRASSKISPSEFDSRFGYLLNPNAHARLGVKSTSGYGFTTTQQNDGALRAGLSRTEFSTLEPDVQNYFVSSTDKQIKDINNLFTDVENGVKTKQEVQDLLDSSNVTPAVKSYLQRKLDSTAKKDSPSWYSRVRSFFGN